MKEDRLNEISGLILGACIDIHRALGPGLLDSVYEECRFYEIKNNLVFEVSRQVELPIDYKGNTLKSKLRLDLLVEDAIIIELKSVEKILPIHKAQIITYLKLSGKPLGLLVNFNETLLKNGFNRYRN